MTQQSQYPVYVPATVFEPTAWLERQLAELGLAVVDVLSIVPSNLTEKESSKPNQWWHLGAIGGKSYKVLVEHRTVNFAKMVTIREMQ